MAKWLLTKPVYKLMMDSGAFTAWSIGQPVDVDKYIEFCLQYVDVVDTFISLDIIPGKKGIVRKLTPSEIDDACSRGWENYQKMIKAGIPAEKCLPVFHQFDDFHWLKHMVDQKVPYLGLSPRKVGVGVLSQHTSWLDSCMSYLTNKDGAPITKIHGFGMTSIPKMLRYPWYSVDSSSCQKEAMYGIVSIPYRHGGEWEFLNIPKKVSISSMSSDLKVKGAHFKTLSELSQRNILRYLKEIGVAYGTSELKREDKTYKHIPGKENVFERNEDHVIIEVILEKGPSNSFEQRLLVNVHFFEMMAKSLLENRRDFKHLKQKKQVIKTQEFLNKNRTDFEDINELLIYQSGLRDMRYLQKVDGHNRQNCRLLSYSFVETSQKEEFEYIVKQRRKFNAIESS